MATNCQFWAVLPLHVYCWTAVPSALAAERASTHLPLPLLTTVVYPVGSAAAAEPCALAEPCAANSTPVTVVATSAATVRTLGIRWWPDSLFPLSTDFSCGGGGERAERVRQPVYLAKMPVNCQSLWVTPEQVSLFG